MDNVKVRFNVKFITPSFGGLFYTSSFNSLRQEIGLFSVKNSDTEAIEITDSIVLYSSKHDSDSINIEGVVYNSQVFRHNLPRLFNKLKGHKVVFMDVNKFSV